MFESIMNFFKRKGKKEDKKDSSNSRDTAKERLHLVLMQDRANVSADFLELMKQEIIEVIKKYIEIDEGAIDVRLTNKENEDGTNGAPALYANIPILNIKHDVGKANKTTNDKSNANSEKAENEEKTQKNDENKNVGNTKKDNSETETDTNGTPKTSETSEKQEKQVKPEMPENSEKPKENNEDSKGEKISGEAPKSDSVQEEKEVKSENVKEKE